MNVYSIYFIARTTLLHRTVICKRIFINLSVTQNAVVGYCVETALLTFIHFLLCLRITSSWFSRQLSQAVVTTTIRPQFDSDCNSTALRPFDDLHHDRGAALPLK